MEISLEYMLKEMLGKEIADASDREIYTALLNITKEKMKEMQHNEGERKLYYISAEFLIGKLLSNNLINLGIFDEVKEILEKNLLAFALSWKFKNYFPISRRSAQRMRRGYIGGYSKMNLQI